ncbi:MAG: adenosylhomocysteinase [Nitrososphaerota archaeon]
MSKVKDPSLAGEGRLKIEWAESRMPVLMKLRSMNKRERPLKGIRIGACLHVTKETAVLVETLVAAGAEVFLAGSNPLSTQDDVAAALAAAGVNVFAWRGLTEKEYYWCLEKVIEGGPNITLDDGADLVSTIHSKHDNILNQVLGGTEETTTGVLRLRAMSKEGKLRYPIIAVNDAETKSDFDNVYGTGQSSIDGIIRATNILFAGKNVVVAGYGHCGRGISKNARGLGANVIVTEIDPIRALRARMDGYLVMSMNEAAKIGDIFITATGNKNVITSEHFRQMKDGAILANAGHFNVEFSIADLRSIAKSRRLIRENNEEFVLEDGKRLYALAEGRLVNLAAAEGHPSEVMDMSFANQFLSVLWMLKEGKNMKPEVYSVPRSQDEQVARLKLESMGIKIDILTAEQERYLSSWREGT